MAEQIRHEGIVLSVSGQTARIEILQASACSSCSAKRMCMSAESQQKQLEARMLTEMEPGDKVEVLITEKAGWKTILLAYIMPFVIMVGIIALLEIWFDNEALTGTIALCAVGVYYLILSLFRKRIQKQFTFTARKTA